MKKYNKKSYSEIILTEKGIMSAIGLFVPNVLISIFFESVNEEVRLGILVGISDNVSGVLNELDLSDFVTRHPISLFDEQKQRVALLYLHFAEFHVHTYVYGMEVYPD